ncbi:MAG: class I SAM-dependent methyltransferase [Candidatus Lindowbacteria bacterium]|nr:class I SAM-dependent methyltransferase [Candidatus Lindowbacteria bacterium]
MREYLIKELGELPEDYWWFYGKWVHCLEQLKKVKGLDVKSVLDIGCGGGQWAMHLKNEFGKHVYGADLSFTSVEAAMRNGIKCAVSDADSSPFQDKSFDLVTALDVIEHLEDDIAFLRDAHRLLRPGGIALIHVPANPNMYSYWDRIHGHYRRYSKRGLEAAINRAGFSCLNVSYSHSALLFPALGVRLLRNAQFKGESAPEGTSEHVVLPPAINSLAKLYYRCEAKLNAAVDLPFGLSLVAIGQKQI